MNTRSRSAILMLAVLALAGCATTTVLRLSDQTYPPTTPAHVRVFLTAADIHRPYRTIAMITAKNYGNTRLFFRALRKKAAALGADGILILKHIVPTTGQEVAAAVFGPIVQTNTVYKVAAIRFLTLPRFHVHQPTQP